MLLARHTTGIQRHITILIKGHSEGWVQDFKIHRHFYSVRECVGLSERGGLSWLTAHCVPWIAKPNINSSRHFLVCQSLDVTQHCSLCISLVNVWSRWEGIFVCACLVIYLLACICVCWFVYLCVYVPGRSGHIAPYIRFPDSDSAKLLQLSSSAQTLIFGCVCERVCVFKCSSCRS